MFKGTRGENQLSHERDLLLWELHDLLDRARHAAGGKTFTTKERIARLVAAGLIKEVISPDKTP